MVHVRGDNEDSVGDSYRISKSYHGKEGVGVHIRDLGNTLFRVGVEFGWDADISHIHWHQAGNCVSVGLSTSDLRSLCMGVGV